ncbi:MAG: hypothetical protein U5L00_04055 [Desulfovermiculus sp.]|nr:hypothetical protein [Desulfovermiculus sp.]
MHCKTCQAEISQGEAYEFNGQALCEDCYLDVVAKPKTCDPWAVYQARQTTDQSPQLTETQHMISAVCRTLNLGPFLYTRQKVHLLCGQPAVA